MKKLFLGLCLAFLLTFAAVPAYAANIQVKIDGAALVPDVAPIITNSRIMIPLRVVCENLGAEVNWANSNITITKDDMQVVLKIGSKTVVKNGKTLMLDVKPYIKNNRTMVPLRFLAETFGCNVSYAHSTVTVDTPPLWINGVKVKALQQEYHMTMGGVIQEIKVNAYMQAIDDVFLENKGNKVEAPANYSWQVNLDTPGAYYKDAQYTFLDMNGNTLQRFDIYSLIHSYPAEELAGYAEVLLYDATADQWYLFSESARQSIEKFVEQANQNGFLTVISNTVV